VHWNFHLQFFQPISIHYLEKQQIYEACFNETHSGIALGEGVETLKNSSNGH
jgi:hypothetical protein